MPHAALLLQTTVQATTRTGAAQSQGSDVVQAQAEQMRAQAEAMRAQAEAMRRQVDAMRERGLVGRPVVISPQGFRTMSRRQEGLAFVGFMTVVMASVIVLRPLFRALGKRLEGAPARAELPAGTDARLERIERAVEAMAIEVERISEGQRFTTRLLSERAPSALPYDR